MSPSAIKGANGLFEHLQSLVPSDGSRGELCKTVIPAIINAVGDIATALQGAHHVTLAGTANVFGDDQLNVDVESENILRKAIANCPPIVTASSEEEPVEVPARDGSGSGGASSASSEVYTVAFDPLDGSSIIAPNWTVGTILGIWDGPTALHQGPAEKQIASILGVYGPRTTVVVAIRVPGGVASCFEIGLGKNGVQDCQIIRTGIKLAEAPFKTRYFAPANLRMAGHDEKYMALITQYIKEGYTLRYCGGLVPDIVHALVKGHGVYVNPVTTKSAAKLRRLYELYPIALILECAGGKAIDPTDGKAILDRALESPDERAGLVCGTAEEVEAVKKALLG